MLPLQYKHDEKVFLLDGNEIKLEDFNPYKLFNFLVDLLDIDVQDPDFEFPDGIDVEEMLDHPLLVGISLATIITGPSFAEYIAQNRGKITKEIPVIIKEAFEIVNGQLTQIETDGFRGHLGFDANINIEGNLTLQTLGDCACLGVDPNGQFILEGTENGFSTYGLHNNDALTQTVSLYAGLGHIAHLALG